MTDGTTDKNKTKKTNKKTLKRNPEAKYMVCTWLKNFSSEVQIILGLENICQDGLVAKIGLNGDRWLIGLRSQDILGSNQQDQQICFLAQGHAMFEK